MESIEKRYISIKPNRDENSICLEVGYQLGGHNWYNGDTERRGYYLYCTPCKITQHSTSNGTSYNTISQILGKGNKLLLKEVSRRSKKAETEAIALAKEKEQFLLERVLTRYGLELEVQQ